MKNLATALMLLLTITTLSPKKAQAGGLLTAVGAGVVGIPLIFLGLGGIGMGAHLADGERDAQKQKKARKVVYGGFLLAVLDADLDQTGVKEFKTIPTYVFDEIDNLGKEKLSEARYIDKNLREVVFSNQEVDQLFSSLDERTDKNELLRLRKVLTTYSNI